MKREKRRKKEEGEGKEEDTGGEIPESRGDWLHRKEHSSCLPVETAIYETGGPTGVMCCRRRGRSRTDRLAHREVGKALGSGRNAATMWMPRSCLSWQRASSCLGRTTSWDIVIARVSQLEDESAVTPSACRSPQHPSPISIIPTIDFILEASLEEASPARALSFSKHEGHISRTRA